MDKDGAIQCRHRVDREVIQKVKALLSRLPEKEPQAIIHAGITKDQYLAAFQSAVQSIRGTFAATMKAKRQFYEEVLEFMKNEGAIDSWEFVGTGRSQDYRVVLPGGYEIGIEAKGCADGNNIQIWSRPTWAREFIIWSQCPDSLQHNPGKGIASGVSRLFRKELNNNRDRVDAFVFFDGRCGSDIRSCPKDFGVTGPLRRRVTTIAGERLDWVPPPCIYLFPSTVPHVLSNKNPTPHDLHSCRFARAALKAFGVPDDKQADNVHWARCALDQRGDGIYRQITMGWGLQNEKPDFLSSWVKVSSE